MLTAAVGEWQFSVFLSGDVDNFIGSLAFNTFYLTGVFLVTRPLLNALGECPAFIVMYTVISGLAGLMVKWFLIGNSPWDNPDASKVGMFAYWACMTLIPLIFLLERRPVQTFVVRYALAYVVLVLSRQRFDCLEHLMYSMYIKYTMGSRNAHLAYRKSSKAPSISALRIPMARAGIRPCTGLLHTARRSRTNAPAVRRIYPL